ncbi:MAG: FAD-binding protein [Burkholderiales bacterium]|nr:FAD-binding protein [Burkholderiales bacterium]
MATPEQTARPGRADAPSATRRAPGWDLEAEVVIVGYGGAGAAAAIEAHDAGAQVLILEKQKADTPTFVHHTPSSRMCAGALLVPSDVPLAARHLELVSLGNTPADICQTWAEEMSHNLEWVEKIGARCEPLFATGETPMYPGQESLQQTFTAGAGPGLWAALENAVEKARKIEVLYECPGRELVTDPETGAVLGVLALREGNNFAVRATRAVILTTGGFQWDPQLLREAFGFPTAWYANPGNTGDGVRMAQKAGAAMWHMDACGGRCIPVTDMVPNPVTGRYTARPIIAVDKYGRRFFDESIIETRTHQMWRDAVYLDSKLGRYPRIPYYLVFDEKGRLAGPLGRANPRGLLADGRPHHFYEWSQDASAEVAKGWIMKGDTIEELVAKITQDPQSEALMDPAVLKETIAEYNACCAAGEDSRFGRPKEWLQPLGTPPYYAMKMLPGGMSTHGGPKRNTRSQVMDPFGKPIPRLYAAGELGSIYYFQPSAGSTLGEALAFGRIAGRNAAAETRQAGASAQAA